MLAAGAIMGAIASRCDGWMTAFAVVALAGALGAGVPVLVRWLAS